MIKRFLIFIGLYPSESDRRMTEMVKGSWKSLRVGRNGGIHIDPAEVRNSEEYKRDCERVNELFKDLKEE